MIPKRTHPGAAHLTGVPPSTPACPETTCRRTGPLFWLGVLGRHVSGAALAAALLLGGGIQGFNDSQSDQPGQQPVGPGDDLTLIPVHDRTTTP